MNRNIVSVVVIRSLNKDIEQKIGGKENFFMFVSNNVFVHFQITRIIEDGINLKVHVFLNGGKVVLVFY